MNKETYWHVTSRENAAAIEAEGFLGGWGDAGFGLYAFDDERAARDYAARGGWDGGCSDPVLIFFTARVGEMESVQPYPGWSDPEAYAHVVWHPMDPDDDEAAWRPAEVRILDGLDYDGIRV